MEGVPMRPPRGEEKISRWSVLTCAVVSVGFLVQLAALLEMRGHLGALQLRFGLGSGVSGTSGGKFQANDYKSGRDTVAAAELARLREELGSKDEQLRAASASVLQERVRGLEEELRRLRQGESQRLKSPPYLEFPAGTVAVKINIGPNSTPMIMCDEAGSTVCLLIELAGSASKYLRELYKGRNNTMVFNLGVASHHGLVAFPLLNTEGVSTSLNRPSYRGDWQVVEGSDFAGVLTLADVLDSINPKFAITLLVTDMQGFDFQAIKSAGDRLRRVHSVLCETYKDGHATYAGVTNAIDADWTPHMAALGFSFEGCADGFKDEVAWELDCQFTNDKFK